MDLCAAPGGWLQVAAKYMPMSSTIVGVDLAPIKPIRGCTTFVDDITTQSCRAQLKRVTPDGVQYDVVIHDGAPNVGGNFAAESYTQAALTLDSLRLASEFLREGGWFVTKVFRSTEYHALLYSMQQLFKKVESTKPVASRGTSAEIYVVCEGYLAPSKIDPRLLDPKHLFADYEGPKQAIDVLSHQKQKRNRSGYEDGTGALYKECPAENFILSDKPTELLGAYHCFLMDASVRPESRAPPLPLSLGRLDGRLGAATSRGGDADDDHIFSQFVRHFRMKSSFASFSEASSRRRPAAPPRRLLFAISPVSPRRRLTLPSFPSSLASQGKKGVVPPKDGFMDLDNHPSTTDEIRALCSDLGVLGRADFKMLLKWRLAVRKSRGLDGKRKAALRGGVVKHASDDEDDSGADSGADEDAEGGAEDEDEKLLGEMAELQRGVDARARRDKKKKAKIKAKERMRVALGLQGQDEEGAMGASEMDLFSLARIKSKGGLDAVQNAAAPGLDATRDSDDDVAEMEGAYDSDDSDADVDGRDDARLEEELDQMWREYKARHTKKGARFTEPSKGRDKRVAIGAGELGSGSEEDDEDDEAAAAMRRAGERAAAEAAAAAGEKNPLLFDPESGAKKKTAGAARDWFANDLFAGDAPAVGSAVAAKNEAKAARRKAAEDAARDEDEDSDASGFDEDDDYFAEGEQGDESEEESEEEEEEEEEDVVEAMRSSRKRRRAKRAGGDSDSDEDDYDALRAAAKEKRIREEEKEAKAAAKTAAKAAAAKKAKRRGVAVDDTYDDDSDSSEDDGGAGLEGNDPTGIKASRARRGADNAGFLEAPAEYERGSDSDSDSDSEEEEDPDDLSDGEKAEVLAIGKNMIRKKDRVRRAAREDADTNPPPPLPFVSPVFRPSFRFGFASGCGSGSLSLSLPVLALDDAADEGRLFSQN